MQIYQLQTENDEEETWRDLVRAPNSTFFAVRILFVLLMPCCISLFLAPVYFLSDFIFATVRKGVDPTQPYVPSQIMDSIAPLPSFRRVGRTSLRALIPLFLFHVRQLHFSFAHK